MQRRISNHSSAIKSETLPLFDELPTTARAPHQCEICHVINDRLHQQGGRQLCDRCLHSAIPNWNRMVLDAEMELKERVRP